MPNEAWIIKDIMSEQFEFDLIFAICGALRLDDNGDIFWILSREVHSKSILRETK
jgi:hypothetical protein